MANEGARSSNRSRALSVRLSSGAASAIITGTGLGLVLGPPIDSALTLILISVSPTVLFLTAYRSYRGAVYGSFLIVSTGLQWVATALSESILSLLSVSLGSVLTLLVIAAGIPLDRKWHNPPDTTNARTRYMR